MALGYSGAESKSSAGDGTSPLAAYMRSISSKASPIIAWRARSTAKVIAGEIRSTARRTMAIKAGGDKLE